MFGVRLTENILSENALKWHYADPQLPLYAFFVCVGWLFVNQNATYHSDIKYYGFSYTFGTNHTH